MSPSKCQIRSICSIWAQQNPNPTCELFYLTPYQLLVSVILSAQATDVMVNRVMRPLYESQKFSPHWVLQLGYEKFLAYIRNIGLAPTKAKHILKTTALLLEQDPISGHPPRCRAVLESLPGVGRKTANVILGELYGEPTLAVDTHVFRVTQRLGWQNEKTPEKAEKALLQILPKEWLPKVHHWLILHGRYQCKARKPLCHTCTVRDFCPSAFALRTL